MLPSDLEAMNEVNRYRHRLEDIREWRGLLPEIVTAISSHGLDLSGVRGTTERLPGGDALAMLAPWAPDATCGDDLPHPDQIVREWAHTIHDAHGQVPPNASWVEHWRFLHDQTAWILASPWAVQWRADIDALWWRLARLTGNTPEGELVEVQRRLADHADAIPDDAWLTLAQLDTAWPGRNLSQRIRSGRSKEKARARRDGTPPVYTLCPDERRRFRVGDVRAVFPETRPVTVVCALSKTW